MALTVAVGATGLIQHTETVYSTECTVYVLPPHTKSFGPVDSLVKESLVDYASALERIINRGQPVHRLASDATSLYAAGYRQAWQVSLPNQGGQWAYSFTKPWLLVQVVGNSSTEVAKRQALLLGQLQQDSLGLQSKLSVPKGQQLELYAPAIVAPAKEGGSELATFAAIGVLAVVLNLVLRWMETTGPRRIRQQGNRDREPRSDGETHGIL